MVILGFSLLSLQDTPLRSANLVSFSALALGIVLLASLVPPGSAVNNYLPALRTGEVAYYSLTGNYGFIPSEPVTQMKVLSVSGTNVTASFLNFFPDGHLRPDFWIDVFSGQRYNSSSLFFFVIATGLGLHDGVFNTWSNVTIIAEGVSPCGRVSRPTVGAQFLFFSTSQTVRISWDQATGALCGYDSRDPSGRVLTLSMINNTIWDQPTGPGALDPFTVASEVSAFLGLPLVAIILFVYFRRKRIRK